VPGMGMAGVVRVFSKRQYGYFSPAFYASLMGSDTTSGSRFGWAVSVSADGSRIAVGAPREGWSKA
jgi:hypothetical protein